VSTKKHNDAYKETKIKTASNGQIIVMLYDEAIRQIDIAVSYLKDNSLRYDKVHYSIMKARDIITELAASLDIDNGGEFASTLFSLYLWFNKRLLEGNLKKDYIPLQEVKEFLKEIRMAWAKVVPNTVIEETEKGVNISS